MNHNMDENGDKSENNKPGTKLHQTIPLTSEPQFDFWHVNGYKKTVKRVDDGSKLCDDLTKMITERADIESNYANKLQGWSKKWTDLISKGAEYGSCNSSWLEVAKEAERLSTIYSELQAMLLTQVCQSISTWKGQHYHKSLLSWKETKNAEEGFSKAHKPYAKRYDTVLKCKKSYFAACVARDQVQKQLDNCTTSSPQTDEQKKKLNDKLTKAKNDVVTTQSDYKEAIRDITSYNPKYKEDMVFMFEKLQESEKERKIFMKSTMQSICQVLNPTHIFERYSQIHDSLSRFIENCDPATDISWWAATYGTDLPFHCVEYEEYNPKSTEEQAVAVREAQKPENVKKASPTDGDGSGLKTEKSSVCTTL
ncbi:protein kinase C and casein kinase substrate in neurons protein 1-like [Actinia tenebrosa]|uniref:Protein kinase C and casein kinase substrate in neurons protein 1-like n=1 Tax=Actinia tenebrosa TaxID=6105 RepID=A0A6P8H0Y0_ACTTE|nr:protein kinase C and casein kinase substrate in neurons protein 1-like [Actinia tenebrosa]